VLSYAISRVLQTSDMAVGVIRIWGTALSFILFYCIVRADFFGDWRFWDFTWADDLFNQTEVSMREHVPAVFGVPMLWGFWIRGILRGQETTTFEDVVTSFGVGVLIVAFVELFQSQLDDSPALVGQIAIPFVAFGLFSIALAHSAQAETDRGRPFERTLLVAVGVSIAALALIAGVAALFDAVTTWDTAQDTAEAAIEVGETVGAVVLWPLEQFLNGVFAALIWLRDIILGTPDPPRPEQAQMGEQDSCVRAAMEAGRTMEQAVEECNPQRNELPQWIQQLIRVLIAVPIVGALILFTALLFTRFRRRGKPGEIKESAYVSGRLTSDLSDLWHGFLNRLRPNIHLRDHLDPVRKLYFEVLEDGERRGVTRRPSQTPNELAPSLDRTFHGPAPGEITAAFDDVRYGQRVADDARARRLRDDWERLRSE
jgi:hypothetical protein